MNLNDKSKARLEGVHSDLVVVVLRAAEISPIDFIITEGARTIEKQKTLVAKGASKTMRSRHIPEMNECGVACAVDLAAVIDGEVRWDWALYDQLAGAMKQAASDLKITIEWGGDWVSFKDGPHFQLPWKVVP